MKLKNSGKNIVVLVSGNGSNLQAIIDYLKDKQQLGRITAVISDKKSAYGLERARKNAIDALFVDPKAFDSRESFDKKLTELIQSYNPHLVVLAGFMRILSKHFVKVFTGRLLNIHPSLLPKYPGLNTHERVIESKERKHGTSVHFVNEELDGGALIAQAELNILDNETSKELTKRVQSLEYRLYPWVIELFLSDRIQLMNDHVLYMKAVLSSPLLLNDFDIGI